MRIFVCAALGVLAVAVNVSSAQGQTQAGGDDRRVEAGVKAGITYANLSISGLPGFDPEAGVGMLAGGWVSAGRERVRLQAEVLFAPRRFSAASPVGDIEVSSRAIDVPVLVVGRFRQAGRIRPLLFAGPYVSFISRVTQTIASTETDIDDDIKDVDTGAVLGFGVEVEAGRGAMVIDARYAFGMRDLSEAAESTFKSRSLMLSFGYRF